MVLVLGKRLIWPSLIELDHLNSLIVDRSPNTESSLDRDCRSLSAGRVAINKSRKIILCGGTKRTSSH
jgi:hypothetical protein